MAALVCIKRQPSDDQQTMGNLIVIRDDKVSFKCVTLELDWENNKVRSSCIPTGKYNVVERHTPERGRHFHVQNVPGRTWILFHPGTYHFHSLGCIMVGEKFGDLNGDGYPDLLNSKKTFAKLLEALPEKSFQLIIE